MGGTNSGWAGWDNTPRRALARAGLHGGLLRRRCQWRIFNEGYTATSGSEWMRPALTDEAVRLGRVLAGLAPREAEVHGLVALMELQASRAGARVEASGRPILLPDQDRSRWDRLLIRRGLATR